MAVEYDNLSIESSMEMQNCRVKSFFSLEIYAMVIESFFS
jgi:hypothetical protein